MVWGQLGYPCPVYLIMADLELLSHLSGENRRQKLSSNLLRLSQTALSMVQQVSTPPLFVDDVGPRDDFPEAHTRVQENLGVSRQITAPCAIDSHVSYRENPQREAPWPE